MRLGGSALLTLLTGIAAPRPAAAESAYTLRMASVAPEGTAWAREMKALARDVDLATQGEVALKWYLGGIAGDDLQSGERVKRGQLDGVASGGILCEQLSPSMRVLHLPGLFRNRREVNYVVGKLKTVFDAEFVKSGFLNLGETILGSTVVFSRTRIAKMSELKRLEGWWWSLDEVGLVSASGMGLRPVALPLDQAGRAYGEGRANGFFALPSAALAFQFSTEARYVLDLPINYLVGCLAMKAQPFDRLPLEYQTTLRSVTAKFAVRFTDVGQQQDAALMSGLFAKQGLVRISAPPALLTEFMAAARSAREQLDEKLIPAALMNRVLELLLQYRAGHFSNEGEAAKDR